MKEYFLLNIMENVVVLMLPEGHLSSRTKPVLLAQS